MSRTPVVIPSLAAALWWGILGFLEAVLLRAPHAIPGSGDPLLEVESLVLYTICGFFVGGVVALLFARSNRSILLIGPLFVYFLLFVLYEVNHRLPGSFFSA